MAHFAEVIDGIVQRVIVIDNDDITDEHGVEQEAVGAQLCEDICQTDPATSTWVQCSYHSSFHHNFPSAGFAWDGTGFSAPREFPSWTLDENYDWQPPVAHPGFVEGEHMVWDEVGQRWVDIVANPPPAAEFPSWT